jgi:carbon storage regulator
VLVLTRKRNQSLAIGENVKITILSVDGEQVRIGIDAPREVRIFRTELIEETGVENKMAAQSHFGFSDFGELPQEK